MKDGTQIKDSDGCRKTIHGAPMVHLPLHLGHIGENLNDEIQDQLCREVIAVLVAGIENGKVQNHNEGTLLVGDDVELPDHLLVITPKTVETLNHHSIARLQGRHHVHIGRASKVLATLLVGKDMVCRDAEFLHGNPLTVIVLSDGGNPDVAIGDSEHRVVGLAVLLRTTNVVDVHIEFLQSDRKQTTLQF